MKKTIIVLMALAGIAAADTLEELWSIDFTTLQRESNGAVITSGGYQFKVWDGTLSSAGITSNYTPSGEGVAEAISRVHIEGDTGVTWGDDFAVEVVFTLPNNFDHKGNWPSIFNMYGDDDNDNLRIGAYVNAQNAADYTYGIDGVSSEALPKPTQDWSTVTLTTGVAHTALLTVVDGAVTLTIDGAVAAKATLNTATNFYDPSIKIDNMLIGGHGGDYYGALANHSWNMDVTVSSLKMYNVVPEPTTATLSLLALCGLAARRRRR